MALRRTEIMKHDCIGPSDKPMAVVVTYRSRKFASGKPFHFRTVVLAGIYNCTILDWNSEADAVAGHAQTLARVERGEPLESMAN